MVALVVLGKSFSSSFSSHDVKRVEHCVYHLVTESSYVTMLFTLNGDRIGR